ncbi:TIGR00341 family protein [Patescibacteria group bacterium]|nr:TIGR00341 family protein [Patescibacteria group bacterium]MBU3999933.1 TIGR00341 family protein [Patescibacteria group bacterium]MBU4057146.1 TIGR00341 family protein [Patescibacteria group bacterium]MBU4368190.1 TIGR00341 family protein [Patescibacteria group bacterium]
MAMDIYSLFYLSDQEKNNAVKKIIDSSSPDEDFFVMLILSGMLATIGLMIDNTAVIIGSTLVTPLLAPILSLALGVSISDKELIRRSIFVLGKSILFVLILNCIIAFMLIPPNPLEISGAISKLTPSMAYFYVAVLSGLAGTFAFVKPKLSAALPGVAIAVALIPPLAAVSIGITTMNYKIFTGSFQLFLINLIGIVFTSLLVFSLMRFYPKRKIAHAEIINENNKLNRK